MPPTNLLHSKTVLSKHFLISRGLTVLLVDENYLYAEEGESLMRAFRKMNSSQFFWCKTDSLLKDPTATEINTCKSAYGDFEPGYLKYEDGIQYWDRLLFDINSDNYVIHTAYAHLLYAGKPAFIDEIRVSSEPHIINGWLRVVGKRFEDPDLKAAYDLP